MAMASAGRILILPKGTWDNLASYDMLDMVTASNNKAYLARKASVGVNPTTDDGTYWQMFGSSVAADGTTIVDDGSGNISVNIDNDTIKYDSTNGYLYVDIDPDKALEDLTDVAITSATNGQALIFDSVAGKWKNGSITSSVSTLTDVNLTNLADGEILKYDANSGKFVNAPETSGGHTYINDNDVTMAQRSKAQFKDLDVTDDSANDKTIISATNKADKTDLTSISETGSTASQAISAGTYFYLNGSLVRAKTNIASGATFVSGTNYESGDNALNGGIKSFVYQAPTTYSATAGTEIDVGGLSTLTSGLITSYMDVLGISIIYCAGNSGWDTGARAMLPYNSHLWVIPSKTQTGVVFRVAILYQ